MSVLDRIIQQKKQRLAAARSKVPLGDLRSIVRDMPQPRDFRAALDRGEGSIRFIAELKKASPSKGLIRPDFDHQAIASIYAEQAVNAISVLTEEDFFQGELRFLDDVRRITDIPLLRKDFIFDDYQIYEARAHSADAVLLIAAMLDRSQAHDLLSLARALGLAVLFEVHDRQELEMAFAVGTQIIGINNRNLKTLAIDLDTTFSLIREIPDERIVVSESGISSRDDVVRMEQAGIDALLIGTSLMQSQDIRSRLAELRGK